MKKGIFALFFGTILLAPAGFCKEPDETGKLLETVRKQLQEGTRTRKQLQMFVDGYNPFLKKEHEAMIISILPVMVNYDLSVDFLVADGKYGWKDSDINSKNFPTTRKGEATLNFEVVHFEKPITSEVVLEELDELGLRPAELRELLAFGIKYPEEIKKYPMIALGSVWSNNVAWLSYYDNPSFPSYYDKLSLHLIFFTYGYTRQRENSKYLAVRK